MLSIKSHMFMYDVVDIYIGNHTYPRKTNKGFGITDHCSYLKQLLEKFVKVNFTKTKY